jgi:hypothetical protein
MQSCSPFGTSPLGSQESAAESEQKPIYAKTRNQPKAKQIEHARSAPFSDRA